MSETIEKFGAYLAGNLPDHPEKVRRLLAAAYRLLGFQARRFPSKDKLPSREYIQSYTARFMADMLSGSAPSAVVNIFMPCEIFHAFGIRPAVPEAMSTYISCTACEKPFVEQAENDGAPPSFCSYHKILMGMAGSGILKRPMMIANTTLACDANQLSFRYLAEKWQVPHFVIDIPYDTGEESIFYVAGQLRDLASKAAEIAGRKLDEVALKNAVARSIRTQAVFTRCLEKRSSIHLPETLSPELLNVMTMHPYLGSKEAETYVRSLWSDYRKAPAMGSRKKILWMHVIPNSIDRFRDIFQGEKNEAVEIIGCDMTYDALVEMDPERPYESMARRIVQDSFNGPGMRRIEKTYEMAEKMGADGILIFCQWGCKQTQGLSLAARQFFEDKGIPALVLDSDGCDRMNAAVGQGLTRIQAFLEQIGAGV